MRQRMTKNFSREYQVFDKLGEGSYGEVFVCVHIQSQMPCAVKIMKKSEMTDNAHWQFLKEELEFCE